jgi:hypothetical protein
MIVLLIVLVIVAFMVIKNWSSLRLAAPIGAGTELAGQKPDQIIEHFKKEADKMGEVPPLPELPKMDEN